MFTLFTRNKNKISFHFISNFHISRISRGNNRKRSRLLRSLKEDLFFFFLKRSSSFFHKKLLAHEKDLLNAWRIRLGQALFRFERKKKSIANSGSMARIRTLSHLSQRQPVFLRAVDIFEIKRVLLF